MMIMTTTTTTCYFEEGRIWTSSVWIAVMNQWYIAYARIYVLFTACNSVPSADQAALPLPLVDPRAIPLPLVPLVAPPRVGIPPLPRAVGMPRPLPAAAGVFLGVGAGLATFLNLLAAFELGGWSTKDVSVVRKVASTSSMPEALRAGSAADGFRPGWFCGRLNESGTGAYAQSVRRRDVVEAHSVLLCSGRAGGPKHCRLDAPLGNRHKRHSCSCRTESRQSSR